MCIDLTTKGCERRHVFEQTLAQVDPCPTDEFYLPQNHFGEVRRF